MENIQTFIMVKDRVSFCLKRLNSFKRSRVLSPVIFLFINYLFVYDLFGVDNYFRTYIIYIVLCILTTIFIYFITTKAIKRYNNIIIEFRILDSYTFETITLIENSFKIKKGEYYTEAYSLTDKKRFTTIVLICNEKRVELIPDWFENSEKLKDLFISN
nr:hypothetical protein [Mucilaginibacter sp. X5P1]